MSQALTHITDRVRARVRLDGVDLSGDRELASRYVRDEVQRYSERALGGSVPMLADEAQAAREIVASITGFGALQDYLDDPEIEEIWINGPDRVFVARGGVPEPSDIRLTATEVRDLVERMLQSSGRRVDLSSPFVDASLPDGSRLHVVIPDVTQKHWAVNIRKFSKRIRDLNRLVAIGSLTTESADFLRTCVLAGYNILVSGATQSGKTTMLGALLSAARVTERIVTVEETFELALDARDTVAMQCRQASLEGTGEITLRRLIKEALRMRPDRLVVGEVREAESLDLLIALNSGLPINVKTLCIVIIEPCRTYLGTHLSSIGHMPEPRPAPHLNLDRFVCARCGAFAHHLWSGLWVQVRSSAGGSSAAFSDDAERFAVGINSLTRSNPSAGEDWVSSTCSACQASSVWRGESMVFPGSVSGPLPHADMPPGALTLYQEARSVLPHSRRAAAALARAALESLLKATEEHTARDRLDDLIGKIHGRVTTPLWQVLTALRIIGNSSLHGEGEDGSELVALYLEGDAAEVVEPFFEAINLLVEELITQPATAQRIYDMIPASKREAAERKTQTERQ